MNVDNDIEVGPGFAEAAEKMGSDDTRTPEQKDKAQVSKEPDDAIDSTDADATDTASDRADSADDTDAGDDGDADADEKPEKGTAKYIRELRRERREDRRRIAELEAKISAPQNNTLTGQNSGFNHEPTREAPDPNDPVKYPLGVLDDRYIEDKIDWSAEQKVSAAINGQRQTERALAAQQAETARLTDLRSKVDDMTDKGIDLFPDFEETVVEAGLAGRYDLTETTFTAASESEHGAEILYQLSKDTKEASRVAKLSPSQQVRWVIEQEGKIAEKRQARRKPQAGDPPSNAPRGRNASNTIRPDTENLDDFRKLFYAKK